MLSSPYDGFYVFGRWIWVSCSGMLFLKGNFGDFYIFLGCRWLDLMSPPSDLLILKLWGKLEFGIGILDHFTIMEGITIVFELR